MHLISTEFSKKENSVGIKTHAKWWCYILALDQHSRHFPCMHVLWVISKAYGVQGISLSCECGLIAGPLYLSTLPSKGWEKSHKCENTSPPHSPQQTHFNWQFLFLETFLLDVILVSRSLRFFRGYPYTHIHTWSLHLSGVYSQALGRHLQGFRSP